MKKIRIFAIVAALLTAVAVYLFLLNINKPNEVKMASVIIASEDIGANTIITSDMVTTAEYPAEAVLAGTARNIGDVVGKTCDGDIIEGEALLTSKLVEPGEDYDTLAYAIEEGQRAFTLAVDDVSGIAGLLRPQDYVDVLLTISIDSVVYPEEDAASQEDANTVDGTGTAEDTNTDVTTEPAGVTVNQTYSVQLLQNIKVLAVGEIINKSELDGGAGYSTVTLSVTPEQAVQLNLAVNTGRIRLILRSPLDSETTEIENAVVDDLLE